MSLQATAKMTDREFEQISKLIYERTGIHFAPAKRYLLESRLGRRLQDLDLDSFGQYLMLLTTGPFRGEEFQELCNRVTINETSFFRNEAQLSVFERTVLGPLIEARSATKRLRIWSAACSTGEEPYTLAMIVQRSLGVRLLDWHVEILGTDLSEKALLTAQQARYGDYSLRGVSPLVSGRYFAKDGSTFVLNDDVKSMVHFEKHNLRDRLAAKRFGTWDVIFCRNVMIYFDDAMRRDVIGTFHGQLATDGTLFIGHSESIRDFPGFAPMAEPESFGYTRTTT